MGNSLKSFRDIFYAKEVRILMCGLDAAGKTTILYKLKLGEVVTTIPTIGFNVETIEYHHVKFVAWDIGGRDKARPLWRHYYQNTDAIMFVVDSNDRERIEDCKYEIHRFLQEDELKDAILLIMANKQDLPNALSINELTEKLGLNELRGIQWYIQSTCAPTGDGLYEGLDWLKSALASKSVKESVVKPVNETKEALKKPQHTFASLYSSVTSYFSGAH